MVLPAPRQQAELVSVNAEALNALLPYVPLFRGFVTDLVLISCLFGILTMLTSAAIYVLIRKGLHLRFARILLAATVTLFTSTTVFFAYELALVAISADIASDVARGLAAAPTSPPDMDERELNRGMYYQAVQVCVSASTVTVNVFVGDAIVWWRAVAIWPGNRLVQATGAVLVTTFLIMGIVMSEKSSPSRGYVALENPFGLACVVLSLTTNIISTSLIGYKAWEHRCFMKAHLGAKNRRTQALRMLALLTESGFAYCALWTFIIAYEIVAQYAAKPLSPSEQGFTDGMFVLIHICLVSLIAIYPMIIIVIVALNRSPIGHVTECLATIDLHTVSNTNTGECSIAFTRYTATIPASGALGLEEGQTKKNCVEENGSRSTSDLV